MDGNNSYRENWAGLNVINSSPKPQFEETYEPGLLKIYYIFISWRSSEPLYGRVTLKMECIFWNRHRPTSANLYKLSRLAMRWLKAVHPS